MLDDPIPALRRQLVDELLAVAGEMNFVIAADVLEIDYSRLSDLRRGRIHQFSLQWLIRHLAKVDRRVDLSVVNTGPHRVRWFRILMDRFEAERRRGP